MRHTFKPTQIIKSLSLITACSFVSLGVFAGQVSTTFQVSATVQNTCTISATDLDFGTILDTSVTVPGTSALIVNCSPNAPYTIGLNAGLGPAATEAVRQMVLGTDVYTYSLYQDAAYNTLWGSLGTADEFSGTGTGIDQQLTVYGQTFAQAIPMPAGTYNDTITATINY